MSSEVVHVTRYYKNGQETREKILLSKAVEINRWSAFLNLWSEQKMEEQRWRKERRREATFSSSFSWLSLTSARFTDILTAWLKVGKKWSLLRLQPSLQRLLGNLTSITARAFHGVLYVPGWSVKNVSTYANKLQSTNSIQRTYLATVLKDIFFLASPVEL